MAFEIRVLRRLFHIEMQMCDEENQEHSLSIFLI